MVLDASAAVEMLIESGSPGTEVRALVLEDSDVHVPELFELEALNTVRGLERAGEVSAARADTARTDLSDLRRVVHRHGRHSARAWELRHNLTIYDAIYVALAESLDAPLVTSDTALATSAQELVEARLIGKSG